MYNESIKFIINKQNAFSILFRESFSRRYFILDAIQVQMHIKHFTENKVSLTY